MSRYQRRLPKRERAESYARAPRTLCRFSRIPSAVFIILGAVVALFSLWDEGVYLFAGAFCVLIGLMLLIPVFTFRVLWTEDTLIYRNIFGVTRFYALSEIECYRTNLHYTCIYLKNGKRFRVSSTRYESDQMRAFLQHVRKNGGKKREKKSDTRIYWGNCTRPVQLTLFLSLFWVLAIPMILLSSLGVRALLSDEASLSRSKQTVSSVFCEDGVATLELLDGTVWFVDMELAPERDWNALLNSRIEILADDMDLCALTDANGQIWFTFDDYYAKEFAGNLGIVLVCGLVSLIAPAFTVLALLAYRDPKRHPRLYDSVERMNFWSRY